MPIFQFGIVADQLLKRSAAALRIVHFEIDGLLKFQRRFTGIILERGLCIIQRFLQLTGVRHLAGDKQACLVIEIGAHFLRILIGFGLVFCGNRDGKRRLQILQLVAFTSRDVLVELRHCGRVILCIGRIADDHLVDTDVELSGLVLLDGIGSLRRSQGVSPALCCGG